MSLPWSTPPTREGPTGAPGGYYATWVGSMIALSVTWFEDKCLFCLWDPAKKVDTTLTPSIPLPEDQVDRDRLWPLVDPDPGQTYSSKCPVGHAGPDRNHNIFPLQSCKLCRGTDEVRFTVY